MNARLILAASFFLLPACPPSSPVDAGGGALHDLAALDLTSRDRITDDPGATDVAYADQLGDRTAPTDLTIVEDGGDTPYYFPPTEGSETWDSVTPESLGWNTADLGELYDFMSQNNTRALLVLKAGRIVIEQYWGQTLGAGDAGTEDFDRDSFWYWASAGKTLTAFLIGLAQEEGLLSITDKTSDHLEAGPGWTSMVREKEDLITIRHQLTMTTGLDHTGDLDCTEASCLTWGADAGTAWFYHNAPYALLQEVLAFRTPVLFMKTKLKDRIGMGGFWLPGQIHTVYNSTARDAARFGLLVLNRGNWDGEQIMTDSTYYEAMVTTSQELNRSYGYLWWLNGKSEIIYPGLTQPQQESLDPNAPADLFAAMGKNGQFIDVVPSQDLVVVRFGEAPSDVLVPMLFHRDMWRSWWRSSGEAETQGPRISTSG